MATEAGTGRWRRRRRDHPTRHEHTCSHRERWTAASWCQPFFLSMYVVEEWLKWVIDDDDSVVGYCKFLAVVVVEERSRSRRCNLKMEVNGSRVGKEEWTGNQIDGWQYLYLHFASINNILIRWEGGGFNSHPGIQRSQELISGALSHGSPHLGLKLNQ